MTCPCCGYPEKCGHEHDLRDVPPEEWPEEEAPIEQGDDLVSERLEAAKNALQVQKACDYYFAKSGGHVGAGDDPVGFLIATLEAMQRDRDNWKECAERLVHHARIFMKKTRSKSLSDYVKNILEVNGFQA